MLNSRFFLASLCFSVCMTAAAQTPVVTPSLYPINCKVWESPTEPLCKVRFTLSYKVPESITVYYNVTANSAVLGANGDYTLSPVPVKSLVIPGNSWSADVTIRAVNDSGTELDENIQFRAVLPSPLPLPPSLRYRPSGVVLTTTIKDNDQIVSTAASIQTTNEGGSVAGEFVVIRSNVTAATLDLPLTVRYTLSGTATYAVDYEKLSGVVTIPAGQVFAVVPVMPIDDALAERPETVILTLSADPSYTVNAAQSTATVTIISNE